MYTDEYIDSCFDTDVDLMGKSHDDEPNRQMSTRDCGTWRFYFDPKTGVMKRYQHFCKNSDICPVCAEREKSKVKETLMNLVGKRTIVISQEDEKKLSRKLPIESYIRQPLEDNKTLFVIDNDIDLEELETEILKEEDCIELAEQTFLERGRRKSGKLDQKPKSEPDGSLVEYREMKIEFDSPLPDAPKTWQELESKVRKEVEIDHSPTNEDELQYDLYLMEQKTKEICDRYKMSFNFLIPKKTYINVNEVAWNWIIEPLNTETVGNMERSLHSLLAKMKS